MSLGTKILSGVTSFLIDPIKHPAKPLRDFWHDFWVGPTTPYEDRWQFLRALLVPVWSVICIALGIVRFPLMILRGVLWTGKATIGLFYSFTTPKRYRDIPGNIIYDLGFGAARVIQGVLSAVSILYVWPTLLTRIPSTLMKPSSTKDSKKQEKEKIEKKPKKQNLKPKEDEKKPQQEKERKEKEELKRKEAHEKKEQPKKEREQKEKPAEKMLEFQRLAKNIGSKNKTKPEPKKTALNPKKGQQEKEPERKEKQEQLKRKEAQQKKEQEQKKKEELKRKEAQEKKEQERKEKEALKRQEAQQKKKQEQKEKDELKRKEAQEKKEQEQKEKDELKRKEAQEKKEQEQKEAENKLADKKVGEKQHEVNRIPTPKQWTIADFKVLVKQCTGMSYEESKVHWRDIEYLSLDKKIVRSNFNSLNFATKTATVNHIVETYDLTYDSNWKTGSRRTTPLKECCRVFLNTYICDNTIPDRFDLILLAQQLKKLLDLAPDILPQSIHAPFIKTILSDEKSINKFLPLLNYLMLNSNHEGSKFITAFLEELANRDSDTIEKCFPLFEATVTNPRISSSKKCSKCVDVFLQYLANNEDLTTEKFASPFRTVINKSMQRLQHIKFIPGFLQHLVEYPEHIKDAKFTEDDAKSASEYIKIIKKNKLIERDVSKQMTKNLATINKNLKSIQKQTKQQNASKKAPKELMRKEKLVINEKVEQKNEHKKEQERKDKEELKRKEEQQKKAQQKKEQERKVKEELKRKEAQQKKEREQKEKEAEQKRKQEHDKIDREQKEKEAALKRQEEQLKKEQENDKKQDSKSEPQVKHDKLIKKFTKLYAHKSFSSSNSYNRTYSINGETFEDFCKTLPKTDTEETKAFYTALADALRPDATKLKKEGWHRYIEKAAELKVDLGRCFISLIKDNSFEIEHPIFGCLLRADAEFSDPQTGWRNDITTSYMMKICRQAVEGTKQPIVLIARMINCFVLHAKEGYWFGPIADCLKQNYSKLSGNGQALFNKLTDDAKVAIVEYKVKCSEKVKNLDPIYRALIETYIRDEEIKDRFDILLLAIKHKSHDLLDDFLLRNGIDSLTNAISEKKVNPEKFIPLLQHLIPQKNPYGNRVKFITAMLTHLQNNQDANIDKFAPLFNKTIKAYKPSNSEVKFIAAYLQHLVKNPEHIKAAEFTEDDAQSVSEYVKKIKKDQYRKCDDVKEELKQIPKDLAAIKKELKSIQKQIKQVTAVKKAPREGGVFGRRDSANLEKVERKSGANKKGQKGKKASTPLLRRRTKKSENKTESSGGASTKKVFTPE